MLHLMHDRWGSLSRKEEMTQDQKIKTALEELKVSVGNLKRLTKEKPEMVMSHVEVRGWVFASQIHLENLEILLHDLQPTLF